MNYEALLPRGPFSARGTGEKKKNHGIESRCALLDVLICPLRATKPSGLVGVLRKRFVFPARATHALFDVEVRPRCVVL